jgi:hypothetical protein
LDPQYHRVTLLFRAIKKGWKLEKGARFHALFGAKKLRRHFLLPHPDILIAYGNF